jgi:hypothetical protein
MSFFRICALDLGRLYIEMVADIIFLFLTSNTQLIICRRTHMHIYVYIYIKYIYNEPRLTVHYHCADPLDPPAGPHACHPCELAFTRGPHRARWVSIPVQHLYRMCELGFHRHTHLRLPAASRRHRLPLPPPLPEKLPLAQGGAINFSNLDKSPKYPLITGAVAKSSSIFDSCSA